LWFAFAVLLQCLGGAEPAQLDVVSSSGTIWPANLAVGSGVCPQHSQTDRLAHPKTDCLQRLVLTCYKYTCCIHIEKKTGYVCLYVGVSICMYVGMCVMYAVYFTHVKYVKVCRVGNG
jgi:hypothetical protein